MDEMDYETIVAEQLEATKARNIDAILSDNIGLNTKIKVVSEMTITGSSALRKALEAKTFHGKLAKPTKEKVIPEKETYADMIGRLQQTYEAEITRDEDEE